MRSTLSSNIIQLAHCSIDDIMWCFANTKTIVHFLHRKREPNYECSTCNATKLNQKKNRGVLLPLGSFVNVEFWLRIANFIAWYKRDSEREQHIITKIIIWIALHEFVQITAKTSRQYLFWFWNGSFISIVIVVALFYPIHSFTSGELHVGLYHHHQNHILYKLDDSIYEWFSWCCALFKTVQNLKIQYFSSETKQIVN